MGSSVVFGDESYGSFEITLMRSYQRGDVEKSAQYLISASFPLNLYVRRMTKVFRAPDSWSVQLLAHKNHTLKELAGGNCRDAPLRA
jgi:hypothetical protein